VVTSAGYPAFSQLFKNTSFDNTSTTTESSEFEAVAAIENNPSTDAAAENEARTQTVFGTILQALCCTMFADGSASYVEREKIHLLMERLKSPFSSGEVGQQMQDFCIRAKSNGFDTVLNETCLERNQLRISRKQRNAVRKCLNIVAEADGTVEESESDVCRRLFASIEK
jgi:uncharacterized tellurite resistance protein B-like protein